MFAEGAWLPEDRDPTGCRDGLREILQALADEVCVEVGQPRDIATRPREAGNQPGRNRIGDRREDDGNDRCRLPGGQRRRRARGDNNIHLERNQFGRKGRKRIELALGIPVFDHDVTSLDITEVTQSLPESIERALVGKIARKVAYSGHLDRLLRLRG